MKKLIFRGKSKICVARAALICVFLASVLSGCIDSSTTTISNLSAAGSFTGAVSAVDISATQIKISWTGGSYNVGQNPAVSYHVFEQDAQGNLDPIATASSKASSYIATVAAGSYHSYVVQAFDSYGNSDGNTNVVSALAYGGITAFSSTVAGSSTIVYQGAAAATGFNVYCALNGGSYTLVASEPASSNTASATLTNLSTGSNYTCKVLALSPAGIEDQNTATQSGSTASYSFTPPNQQYQGVILVQALGDAPNAPATPPQSAAQNLAGGIIGKNPYPVVSITWNAFTGASFSNPYTYALIRTGKGGAINVLTTAPCTATTQTSCLVCTVTSGTNPTCQDGMTGSTLGSTNGTYVQTVGDTPNQYDYVVTRVINGVREQLPSTDTPYRITVPIPPAYMALVHRDSVNYEMCMNLLGRTGGPSAGGSDPLNHQRCTYTGLGALPYYSNSSVFSNPILNTGSNVGYYDFGYDLFVDRFGGGCNWTPSSSGGMCGAGHTSGNCYGSGSPSSTIGVSGNVYYDYTTSGMYNDTCWVNVSGTWRAAGDSNYSPTSYSLPYTNIPSSTAVKPPLVGMNTAFNEGAVTNAAYQMCQSSVDPYYGQKRLLRRREQIAAAGWPTFSGEPGAMTLTEISGLQNGMNHPTSYACNSNTHNGVSTTGIVFNGSFGSNTYTSVNELARSASGGPDSFVIGSVGTSACVSRFGIQDLVGNVATTVSDTFLSYTSASNYAEPGTTSPYDPGNTDLVNYGFDGVNGPGGGTTNVGSVTFSSPTYNAYYFSAPLGMPFLNANGSATPSSGTSINNALCINGSSSCTQGTSPAIAATVATNSKLHSDVGNISTSSTPSSSRPYRPMITGSFSFAGQEGWYMGASNGRFTFDITGLDYSGSSGIGFRCALPAE